MTTCPALSTGDAFLSALLRHIDCQGQTIGAAGYQALADPGSPLSLALTALLTIFVALFGLRMMLGEAPTLRDGVMAVARIGVVLAIATSWPAYRTIAYDLIVQGPAQLSAILGGSADLPGADGDLIGRLQAADASIGQLINHGTGRNDVTSVSPSGGSAPGEPPERTPIADDPAFGAARVIFLSSTVAAFVVVRLTAGILLALAPLFAGLLLFGLTRGLVIGWARALAFTLVASTAATLLLGVELALLEPWLAQVLGLREDKVVTAAAPVELLILCLGFAIALAGSFAVILRLAFSADLSFVRRLGAASAAPWVSDPVATALHRPEADPPAPRARRVAEALMASQRREQVLRTQPTFAPYGSAGFGGAAPHPSADEFAIPAPGQGSRRTRSRKSLGAALRDRRS